MSKQFLSTVLSAGMTLALAAHLPLAHATRPIPAAIQKSALTIELQSIATGLASPNYLTDAGDGSGRLFVVDQPGKIHLIKNGTVSTFLDLSSRMPSTLGTMPGFGDYDERGLLGLAFHPEFANQNSAGFGRFYTFTSENVSGAGDYGVGLPLTDLSHQNVIAEWRIDKSNPDVANPLSRRELLRIDHPQFNHDGGMLAFGPDNNLYIGLGDGGAANDVGPGHGTSGNAQNLASVHGKILRIDVEGHDGIDGQYGIPANNPFVDTSGVPAEIFASGLRNPFRFSFDKQTGDLIVGDVGQESVEEVDIVTAGGNYGWNLKEGTFKFDPVTGEVSSDLSGLPGGLIDPVLQYDHDEGIAVIGGFVYRGSAMPGLVGKYIFGDYSKSFGGPAGRLLVGDLTTGLVEELKIGLDDRALGFFLKGLGQDADGELYALVGMTAGLGIAEQSGRVLKLTAAPVPVPAAIWLLGSAVTLIGVRRRKV
jgi:glucose/arabinose dehydrogenase